MLIFGLLSSLIAVHLFRTAFLYNLALPLSFHVDFSAATFDAGRGMRLHVLVCVLSGLRIDNG